MCFVLVPPSLPLLCRSGVGKSSLVWRLTKNLYHPEQRPSTEVSITAKSMKALPGLFVHADLWDVPGTEAIDMGDILFQEVDLAVLVCSLDDKECVRAF